MKRAINTAIFNFFRSHKIADQWERYRGLAEGGSGRNVGWPPARGSRDEKWRRLMLNYWFANKSNDYISA